MKDHTANVIVKRMAEIAANEASVRSVQRQIASLNKDIEEKEQHIFKTIGQIKGMHTEGLSAEQLAKVVEALCDENEYHSNWAELAMSSSVYTLPTKTYLRDYRIEKLNWIASNFELSSEAIHSDLTHLLQDYPEMLNSKRRLHIGNIEFVMGGISTGDCSEIVVAEAID